jgi:hypothetical protein
VDEREVLWSVGFQGTTRISKSEGIYRRPISWIRASVK